MQWQPAADGQRKMQKQPRRALTVLICLMTQTRPSRRREALYTTPKAPRPSTSPSRNWSARKAETAEAGWRRLIPCTEEPAWGRPAAASQARARGPSQARVRMVAIRYLWLATLVGHLRYTAVPARSYEDQQKMAEQSA
jgi:hypothetical protein